MGAFVVDIEVGDPAASRFETVEALVDTGATYTLLPASLLESLEVAPISSQGFILADGRRILRDIGETPIRIGGRTFHSPVVFSDENSNALLGAVTLQVFGLGVDTLNERLVPVDGLLVSPTIADDL